MIVQPKMWLAFRFDIGTNIRFLIARVTGAPVHVEVLYGDSLETARAYGADWGGIRTVSWPRLRQGGTWRIVGVPCYEPTDLARSEQDARAEVGWKYDFFGVLYAWWFGRRAGNAARYRRYCSEFAAARIHSTGLRLSRARDAAYTPRLLWDEVSASWGWADA